ncbi:type III secretion system inner membrane ring lipoprotein SctJ [Acanthopleuribacter pedis]|uniref:Type III secretion inner membrane ring lipoprotein SctJ n=1 Tax=Acanthopleuribacter pedis TaxID=442870 RepID=A0A8J7QC67_9BACT|nr:type III secretion inner membrane ring lipoprotein SctJ [Acanthopleuribacter pedis]MBO1322981.1 type III secretion inner membrane ring lipoprotein SctJ [Acanthopleuribacter pedis]
MNAYHRFVRLTCCFALILAATACQTELYSDLSEKEANEMLALLLDHGFDSEKQPADENRWNLVIEENQLAAAVKLLNNEGYPRDQFANLGNIFEKDGLVSSPMEERARFVYGLSQEISQTLSQIQGVLSARVHVALPKQDPLNPNPRPASASVFIKHRPSTPLENKIPEIKELVVNSIEGLAYDKVSVALFPVVPVEPATPASGGSPAAGLPAKKVWLAMVLVFFTAVCLTVIAGYFFLRNRPATAGGSAS